MLSVLSEPGAGWQIWPGKKGLELVREDFPKVLVAELEGGVGSGGTTCQE